MRATLLVATALLLGCTKSRPTAPPAAPDPSAAPTARPAAWQENQQDERSRREKEFNQAMTPTH